MKNYPTWLTTAAIFQFIFAAIHTATLFIVPLPTNDTEKQLFALMSTYKFDFGAGFHKTMDELTFVFSACLCLLMLFGGLINWYLLRKKAETEIMKGVITINLVVFGICFVVTATYAFLFPIILSGLILIFLLLSRFAVRKSNQLQWL
jgi:hypothetical protein